MYDNYGAEKAAMEALAEADAYDKAMEIDQANAAAEEADYQQALEAEAESTDFGDVSFPQEMNIYRCKGGLEREMSHSENTLNVVLSKPDEEYPVKCQTCKKKLSCCIIEQGTLVSREYCKWTKVGEA